MGCWNETCAVSKMTINTGEKVRFLLIAQNPFSYEEVEGHPDTPTWIKGGTGCYLTDFWQPVSLPILAEYNDYGTIDNWDASEQPYIDLLLHVVNKSSIRLDLGENTIHDTTVGEDLTFEQFLEIVREGRLYLKAHGTPVATSAVFIKESVWQSLLNDANFTEEDTSDMWKAEEDTLAAIQKRLDKQVKLMARRDTELRKMASGVSTETVAEMKETVVAQLEEIRELMESQIECSDNRSITWNLNPYRHLMTTMLINDVRFAEIERVFTMLSILRINLSPTIGSGSQAPNERLFRKVYQLWGEIADKQTHFYDEDE